MTGEWLAEKYVPHEAEVRDAYDGRPWQGAVWPFCPMKSIPHDAHLTNEGNTWCRGLEGIVAPKPIEGLLTMKSDCERTIAELEKQLENARYNLGQIDGAIEIAKVASGESHT